MEEFHCFPRFPESVRKQIWKHAAFWPRVVTITEVKADEIIKFSKGSSTFEEIDVVVIASQTRPPAILSVCTESRSVSFTIYQAMVGGKSTKGIKPDYPIYVNPEVDIIYRGKGRCRYGGAFQVHFGEGTYHKEPIAATRTLAVDLIGLTRRGVQYSMHTARQVCGDDEEDWPPNIVESLTNTATQLADCAIAGLRELLVVVGNDDDATEVTLVPLPTDVDALTPREKGALDSARQLREDLVIHWKQMLEQDNSAYTNLPIPNIQVVTVLRTPSPHFNFFPKLPPELQDMIWEQAIREPKVHRLEKEFYEEEPRCSQIRQPALASVCRSSRRIFMGQTYTHLPGELMPYFNPAVDTVHLDIIDGDVELRDFSKLKIQSLGLNYEFARLLFPASDAKLFAGLREIVIIVGESWCDYEKTLVPVAEDLVPLVEDYSWDSIFSQSLYVRDLRAGLETVSKRWKAYQKRRIKQGKSSPDWIVPTVRIARLATPRQAQSPYTTPGPVLVGKA